MGRKKKVGRKALSPTQKKKSVKNASEKWTKEHTKNVNFRFNLDSEQHLLDWLDKRDNKARYVKDLILEDMKKSGD